MRVEMQRGSELRHIIVISLVGFVALRLKKMNNKC